MVNYYKKTVFLLLSKLNLLRKNPSKSFEICLEIQEILLRKITYLEKQVHKQKLKIATNKQQLKTKQTIPYTKEQSSSIKSQIEYSKYLVGEYQNLQYLFRTIGDALAYTYINKWDIKPLAFKQSAGNLSGKKGARLERKILRKLHLSNHIAILNDITNCLRYGDITIYKEGYPIILEVKSGKNRNERAERQYNNIEKMVNYWNTDRINGLYEGDFNAVRKEAHAIDYHHGIELNKIIQKTLESRKSQWQKVESGVYYFVAEKFDISDFEAIFNLCADTPLVYFLNQGKYENTAYYPFSLSIKDPIAFLKFYAEELYIFVVIDKSVIKDKLISKSLNVSFDENQPFFINVTFKEPKDIGDSGFIKLSQHMFGRIAFEFMSLDWILEEIISNAENINEIVKLTTKS